MPERRRPRPKRSVPLGEGRRPGDALADALLRVRRAGIGAVRTLPAGPFLPRPLAGVPALRRAVRARAVHRMQRRRPGRPRTKPLPVRFLRKRRRPRRRRPSNGPCMEGRRGAALGSRHGTAHGADAAARMECGQAIRHAGAWRAKRRGRSAKRATSRRRWNPGGRPLRPRFAESPNPTRLGPRRTAGGRTRGGPRPAVVDAALPARRTRSARPRTARPSGERARVVPDDDERMADGRRAGHGSTQGAGAPLRAAGRRRLHHRIDVERGDRRAQGSGRCHGALRDVRPHVLRTGLGALCAPDRSDAPPRTQKRARQGPFGCAEAPVATASRGARAFRCRSTRRSPPRTRRCCA